MDEEFDFEGFEDISLNSQSYDDDSSDGNTEIGSGEEEEDNAQTEAEECGEPNVFVNLLDIDINSITARDVKEMLFADLDDAYVLYNEYAKCNGFSVRKNKRGKNKNNEITWQQFVCSLEGYRLEKYINLANRQREHRALTRCGCEAEMRLGFDAGKGRWYVSRFFDEHNHQLLGDKYYGLLRSHRRISDADVAQIDSMRKSGISIPNIYGSFASQSGGYHNIGFRQKELYNRIQKERRLQDGDVKEAIKLLNEIKTKDCTLFWSHKISRDRRLLHLFWSDGSCQIDYEVFGDVLAFDATYGRNKYKCPVVVFSGVNHHKQTCVFACGIVSDEREETYVWLLQQFLEAMKGKSPKCVITDGDLAMKNAIAVVFPDAHHRLCGWHLIRNVTSNVRDIRFTQMFKNCMLSTLEVHEFEDRWAAAVEECGLTQNDWVQQLYGKKLMWSTAHIRGKFFAGLRTTSRCEALHAHMGRYVRSRFNLREFVYHFQRCLEYIRSKEIEADFKSAYGVPVMQTEAVSLEKYASQLYTREMFLFFRQRLARSMRLNILDMMETATSKIFFVGKLCRPDLRWHVSFYPQEQEVRCSCLAMESDGIPCTHILKVLVVLEFDDLPKCLVLDRWTKGAKSWIESRYFEGSMTGNSVLQNGRYSALIDGCRRLCTYAIKNSKDYNDIRDKIAYEIEQLQSKHGHHPLDEQNVGGDNEEFVGEPVPSGQTCDGGASGSRLVRKKPVQCGCCKGYGHTRKTCKHARRIGQIMTSDAGTSSGAG